MGSVDGDLKVCTTKFAVDPSHPRPRCGGGQYVGPVSCSFSVVNHILHKDRYIGEGGGAADPPSVPSYRRQAEESEGAEEEGGREKKKEPDKRAGCRSLTSILS